MGESKKIAEFADGLSNEKPSGFRDKEYTITDDRKLGYRLDHQGVNKDKLTKPHRIYIQPCKGGKSRMSKGGGKLVLADVHCDDPADAEEVRDALKQSYKNNGSLVVVWGKHTVYYRLHDAMMGARGLGDSHPGTCLLATLIYLSGRYPEPAH